MGNTSARSGNRVAEVRRRRQLEHGDAFDQAAVAARIGCAIRSLRNWERGASMPTRRHARALARELGVRLSDLGLGFWET